TEREIHRQRKEYVHDANSLMLLASQAVRRKFDRNMEYMEETLMEYLKYYIKYGESGSVGLKVMKDRIEAIKAKLTDSKLDDIYNCDEADLFLTVISNRTHETAPIRGKKTVR
ncbi:hypothetical protein BX616_005357, partial [Lobosporangium transversale]